MFVVSLQPRWFLTNGLSENCPWHVLLRADIEFADALSDTFYRAHFAESKRSFRDMLAGSEAVFRRA